MKKFLITFLFVFAAVSLSAQNISYANLVKLVNMTSVSSMSSTLRSWGYKLGKTGNEEDYEFYEWGWGDTKYNSDYGDWLCGQKAWTIACLMKFQDSRIFYFNFSSSSTFEQLKSQVKANGWQVTDEYQNETGFHIKYEKESKNDFLDLKESTSPAGGFSIFYFKFL